MDRLKALAVFKAVVDHGSFSRAAEALGLSPAAVTRTVQELETLLAARLLQRTTRRIMLTSVGTDVLERARAVLVSFDELSNIGRRCGSEPAGIVRLVAPAWLGRSLLAGLAAGYLGSCPNVSLELRLHSGEAGLIDVDADLILCLEGGMKLSWVARKLAQVDVGLCASPAYLERRGMPISPRDLRGHDSLAGGAARIDSAWHLRPFTGGQAERAEIVPVLYSNQPETLLGAAVHGAGIASLPDLLVAEALANGSLQRVMPGWCAEPLSLHLAYESRLHQPLSVRRLIDTLVSAFADIGTPRNGTGLRRAPACRAEPANAAAREAVAGWA